MPNGFLLIDKPVELRSAECVAHVKRMLGKKSKQGKKNELSRVGHAGTLDSTASGLLVLLLGSATRLSDYVMKLPKTYEATMRLGAATDTCDASGHVIFRGDVESVSEQAFDRVLRSFWGMRMQRPPEISALKIGGKPSHEIAREGQEISLASRSVFMSSVRRCSPISRGSVRIAVVCGKGTYIRALVRDIGEALGCGAHVEELRRLSTGPFNVCEAYAPEAIANMSELSEKLRSPREIVSAFHRIILTEDAERRLMNGLCVPLADAGRYVSGSGELRHGLCVEGVNMIGFADINAVEGGAPVLKPRANIFMGELMS